MQESPIFQACYEHQKWLYQLLEQFPRSQRHYLGAQLVQSQRELQQRLILATKASDPQRELALAEVQLSLLRSNLNIAYDLHIISAGAWERTQKLLNAIGRRLGAWQRLERKRASDQV